MRYKFKWIPRSLVSIISTGTRSPYRITTEQTHHVCPLTLTHQKNFTHKSRFLEPPPLALGLLVHKPNRSISRPGRDVKFFFFFSIPSTDQTGSSDWQINRKFNDIPPCSRSCGSFGTVKSTCFGEGRRIFDVLSM